MLNSCKNDSKKDDVKEQAVAGISKITQDATKRKRNYNESFLKYGFTCNDNDAEKNQCA